MRLPIRAFVYLLLDAFLLATCIMNVPTVVDRPGSPFEVVQTDSTVVVDAILDSSACPGISSGDILLKWDGKPTEFAEIVEYLADLSTIGSRIPVEISREGSRFVESVQLIAYYPSLRFLIISLFVGLTVFAVGVFILLARPEDVAARALHWALITLGTTMMMTWGGVDPGSVKTYIFRSVWFTSYLGVAVSFFFFTLVFPRVVFSRISHSAWLLVIAVIVLGTAFSSSQLLAFNSEDVGDFRTFQAFFDVFHVALFVFVGGGLFNIARATLKASSGEERRKMYWILWGLAIGVLPYLILHILPQLVLSQYIVPEEFTTVFFLAVPVSFAIALLKYHLFDVEVMINRTIVYGVLSFFIVAVYMLVVLLVASIIQEEVVLGRYFVVAAVTLLIGLLANPLRLKLQRIVDGVLFSARANYRRALTGALEVLQKSMNHDELFRGLVRSVRVVLPSELVAAYEMRGEQLACASFDGPVPQRIIPIDEEGRHLLGRSELLVRSKLIRGERWRSDPAQEAWLLQCGASLCIPLRSLSREILGALVVNPRMARETYDEEEITFLISVTAQATEILERLLLQEKIILAQEESRRSEELSNLKSYFISSVSHELRMPLTSIRMFAEMLRNRRVRSRSQEREYLEIIEGESERLSRLIGNILDFAKIERGVKEYTFADVKIDRIVKRAVIAMRYQYVQNKALLRTTVQKGLPTLRGDADALEEALLNLLSNALKYSTLRKEVELKVVRLRRHVVISVSDKGIGIPEAELPNIFDRFYRVRDERTRQIGGAGLGLALVKHIVEAHNGEVSVKSAVGKGTTVTIELPFNARRKERKP
jgi:signal transduction histidine kinase